MVLSPGRTMRLIDFFNGISAAILNFQCRVGGSCSRSHQRAPNSLRKQAERQGRWWQAGECSISLGPGPAILPLHHVLLLPIWFHRNGSKKDRRLPSLPTVLKALFARQRKPQGTRMLLLPLRVSCSSASRLGCLTKSKSTWCLSCSAQGFDCSNI